MKTISTIFVIGLLLAFTPKQASALHYEVTPLVSDLASLAPKVDPNLINPWGFFFSPSGDFWTADNGSNLSTLYMPDGSVVNFIVNVASFPTGAKFNPSATDFLIHGFPAKFLFATENGTILGFNSSLNPNDAVLAVDNSATDAVYKGLEFGTTCCLQTFLVAADFHNGKIDRFDTNFVDQGSFLDSTIPSGYAPFNVQMIGKFLYVTFAKQLAPGNRDDDPGLGNGFVDVFTLCGSFVKRLISQGNLNSPWGLALAPSNFHEFSSSLLVGNFGDGKINAYDINTGAFLGQLEDATGNPIVIDGLWSLEFDSNGLLYFTSGPNGEADGLVGFISPL